MSPSPQDGGPDVVGLAVEVDDDDKVGSPEVDDDEVGSPEPDW